MSPPRRADASSLADEYRRVRALTERLAAPLSAEDQGLQSMPACSPTKWHRAHTTWFFETFVLEPRGVPVHDARYGVLFNSYYVAIGARHARPARGLLSRPSAEEVTVYRRAVDARMLELLERVEGPDATEAKRPDLRALVELGLAHEQQHQELILTDVLHAFAQNPLRPAYRARDASSPSGPYAENSPGKSSFIAFEGGLVEIGAGEGASFRFDNEEPRHRTWLEPFALADRLLTVGEWKEFARAKGYERAGLWLSEGFDWASAHQVQTPLHSRLDGDALIRFGLRGEHQAHDDEPITHLSFYEADALARFFDARLPTEAEWEHAACHAAGPVVGNFLEDDALEALPARAGDGLRQLHGDAWEWTSSGYSPYPGFRAPAGALGEYNGKFMVNQLVLRGGSCLTPRGHVRPSYRNFWHPDTRFQRTGVRLARSGKR